MAKIIDARIKLKRSTNTGEVPTAAPSNDHLDGTWDALDIYKGELFVNTFDTKAWIRTDLGIVQMPFLKDNQNNAYNSTTASGTDTYTATLTPTLTAYAFGQTFVVSFTNANTGAATINIDSLGAKALQKNGTALASGNLGAGKSYILYYDGTQFQVLGLTSSGGGITNSAANNYVTKSDGTNVVQSQIYDSGTYLAVGATSASALGEVIRLKVSDANYIVLHDNATVQMGTYIGGTDAYMGTLSNHALILTSGLGAGVLTLAANGDLQHGGTKLYFQSGGTSTLLQSSSSGSNKTITLPNATGTVALGTGTTNELSYWVDANTLGALAVATYPSLTELSYVKGLTSAIQTQLNARPVDMVTVGVGGVASPSDGSTLYFGIDFASGMSSALGAASWKTTKASTSVDVFLRIECSAGSNENVAFYLRNITTATDYTITTTATLDAAIVFISAIGLAATGSAGDEWEVKMVNPTWGTNPTGVKGSGTIKYYA